MFELTYGLNKIGKYDTFEEAFAELYKKLNKDYKGQGLSQQFLETTIWIERNNNGNPLFFYEARDYACKIGLLKDGVLDEEVLEKAKQG